MKLLIVGVFAMVICSVWATDASDIEKGKRPGGSPSASATDKNQAVTFQTDFSGETIAIRNFKFDGRSWLVEDGILKTVGNLNRSIAFGMGEVGWQDYEVEFKVKRMELDPKDQHFGIFIRCSSEDLPKSTASFRLYCRGDSINYIECVGNRQTRAGLVGSLPKQMEVGESAPWITFRIAIKGNQARVYVDNMPIGDVNDIVPENGKIFFCAYNLNLWLDDLKVAVTRSTDNPRAEAEPIRNILRNSSFEQCTLDDLPDYWGCNHWGISDPYWVTHFEEWVKNYGVDRQSAFDGRRSMRIHNPFDKIDTGGLLLRSTSLGTKVKVKYTFSAYLKSQTPGMKVSFNGREIVLTDQWQRYSNPFVNKGRGLGDDVIGVYPLTKGVFWVDAAQLEEGENLTPYQTALDAAPLQTQEGNQDKVITEVPKYEPRRFDETVALDGRLEEAVWEKAEKLDLVNINGQTAIEQTEARIWYNAEGIYIGIKCFDENAGENECKISERDGSVWTDSSIEVFIDPKLTRSYYYQLAFNQKGVQSDAFCGDLSWNGAWRVATHTDGNYWSAEVFLPFGETGIDRGTGDWWGMNICRNNRNKKEFNCWSPTYGSYHTPERFGQIHIDQKILNRYCFGCNGPELQRGSDDKVLLSMKMRNDSDQDGTFLVVANLKNAEGTPSGDFEQTVKLAKGENKTIALGAVTGKSETKYLLHTALYSQDKKTIYYAGNEQLEIPSYFTLIPQYDLYTQEKEMLIKVRFNLNADSLKGAKLELEGCAPDGKTVFKKVVDQLAREMDLKIRVGDLAVGNYQLKARLFNNQEKQLADTNKSFRKIEPVPYEVKIDHLIRMAVVDGKPFMPLGFAWEGPLTAEVLKYLAENGCNAIWYPFTLRPGNDATIRQMLDDALKAGIKVTLAFHAEEKESAMALIVKFKNHPALLAWDIFDERFALQWGRENYALIKDRCAELKQADPYHPVYINENQWGLTYLKGKNLDFPGDVVSIDYYAWTPGGNFQVTGDYMKTMEAMGRKAGKPNWIFLLGAGYAYWASRDYTPAEQEFSTYISAINGGSGIFYWASHPKSKSQWERIKGLFQELKELTPILASTLEAPSVKCAAPSIQLLTKRQGDAIYVIAVNSSKEPVAARFDLSALELNGGEKQIEVLFEKRQIKARNSTMEDHFEGFQRHVYRINSNMQVAGKTEHLQDGLTRIVKGTGNSKMPKMLTDSIPYEGVFSFGRNKGYIKVPENYESQKQYPLILFFHGRGGSALENNFTSDVFKAFREKASRNGCIVAVPEYGTSSWFNETAENITLEMLDFLNRKLSLASGYYVMGCSMGGGSALVFAARHKEKVKAVCDIFGVTDYARFYNEGHYRDSIASAYGGSPSENPQVYRDRSAINHIDDLKDIPVLVIHGDKDSAVPKWNSDLLVEKLKQANGKVEYIVVSGRGHENGIVANLEDRILAFPEK
ncbi:MAG: prolyl oligopeptidase family serine peptidase [Victivallales bacterium]